MKSLATSISVVLILVVVASFSVTGAISYNRGAEDEISTAVEKRNPWTSLDLNNNAEDFQFVIVTDRTGGRRPGVFTQAVEKINLLQPEFVMTVGDMIEGYTEDPGMWALEWSEFESKIAELQMPFFFCPGNHDISNLPMSKEWQRKFGNSYYHFKYRDVLFLVLNTEEVRAKSQAYLIGQQQQHWAAEVLQNNQDVRWTFVILHKPTWTYPNADHEKLGWAAVEQALQGRRYTVFAGHKHQYARFVRKGQEYYMLATTGGASNLSGVANGRFDHFVWVTMKNDGPVIANLLLDGVESKSVRTLPNPEPAGKTKEE